MTHIAPKTAFHKADPQNTIADHFSHQLRCRSKPLDGPLSDLRRNQLVLHLHGLGPRPVSEYLKELLGIDAELQADALFLLEKYAALDPGIVRALGGSTFPPILFAVKTP